MRNVQWHSEYLYPCCFKCFGYPATKFLCLGPNSC